MLKLKKRPVKSSRAPAAPPPSEEITADTIAKYREKYPVGTVDRARVELTHFEQLHEVSREYSNAANRQKTAAGKAVKALFTQDVMKHGDLLQFADSSYSFDFAESEKVDTEKFFKLYEDKKITRETFLQCIGVNKDKAAKIVGNHVLVDNGILTTVIGNKADVRITKLDKPVKQLTIVPKPRKIIGNKNASRDIDAYVNIDSDAANVNSKKIRRKIRVKARS